MAAEESVEFIPNELFIINSYYTLYYRLKDKIERIAHKFLGKAELNFIQENDRIDQLYVTWCAKEAIYKLHGKKNISFLEHIKLEPFEYPGSGSFLALLNTGSRQRKFRVHYEKFNGYMIGFVADDHEE